MKGNKHIFHSFLQAEAKAKIATRQQRINVFLSCVEDNGNSPFDKRQVRMIIIITCRWDDNDGRGYARKSTSPMLQQYQLNVGSTFLA